MYSDKEYYDYIIENTRSIIASILEHSAGSNVTTTPDVLRWAIVILSI